MLRRDWTLLRTASPKELLDKDPEFKRQIMDTVSSLEADTRAYGTGRAVAKHGALLALAMAARWLSVPILTIGALVLAHAAYRWLH